MRRVIAMCLVLIIVFGMTPSVFAVGGEMDEQNVDLDTLLLDRGYPQIILDTMSEDSKQRVLDTGGDFAGGTISYYDEFDEQGHQIVVNEDGSYITPRGQISASDLTLSIVYSRVREAVGRLSYIQVTYNYNWLHLPSNRLDDVMTVTWDSDKFKLGSSFHKEDQYDGFIINADGSLVWYYNQIHSAEDGFAQASPGGVYWYAELCRYAGFHVTGLHGYGDFKLLPKEQTFGGSSELYAHYVHAKADGSIGITIGVLSVTVNSTSSYDERGILQSITW